MQLVTIGLDPKSDGVHDCPKVTVDAHDADGPIYIQAPQVIDPEAREVFLQAARRILRT
jgi:hypothetical protein